MRASSPWDDLRRILSEIRRLADEASSLASRLETPAPAVERPRPDRLLLTVPEAARALSLSKTSMYELVLRGDVASVKIGKSRRIPFASLEEFVRGALGDRAPERARGL